jgi:hypothetical protein
MIMRPYNFNIRLYIRAQIFAPLRDINKSCRKFQKPRKGE